MGYYFTHKKIGFMKYAIYYTGKEGETLFKCYTKRKAIKIVSLCTRAREIQRFNAVVDFRGRI